MVMFDARGSVYSFLPGASSATSVIDFFAFNSVYNIFCIRRGHDVPGFFKLNYRFLIEALIFRKPHGFHENFALFGNAGRMA